MLSAFKNFLITFLVSALIFGPISYFTAGYVSGIVSSILDGEKDHLEEIINNTPENTEDDVKDPPPEDPDLKIPEGESFTFVIVGTDYRPDIFKNYYHTYEELDKLAGGLTDPAGTIGILGTSRRTVNATWIVLVRADKENREYVSTYISPETLVGAPTGDATLGDVYGRYGISVLCEYIEAMTRLNIDYSFVIDGISGIDFLSSMGSVKFSLDSDIYSSDRYHLSASTSVITHEVTVTEPAEESDESSSEPNEPIDEKKEEPKENASDKKDGEDDEKDYDDPEEIQYETEIVDNALVLHEGNQSLSDYSVHILNTFKEMSDDDISVKSKYILDMVEQYLRRCADWSESELTKKIEALTSSDEKDVLIDDPFSSKPVLATNFTHEKVAEIYSMLEAVEYFEYQEYIYPGEYSADKKMYIPDITEAVEFFDKYNNK